MFARSITVLAAACLPTLLAAQEPGAVLAPSIDSAAERQTLRTLSLCLAKARPTWARKLLDQPYLQGDQRGIAQEALTGSDTCQRQAELHIVFRVSGMVGALAEHFLRRDPERLAPARLAAALSRAPARNASEDFAMCLAARDVGAARTLALSVPGSAEEAAAAQTLAAGIRPCSREGEVLTVDLQSLRALVSIALYRGANTPSLL